MTAERRFTRRRLIRGGSAALAGGWVLGGLPGVALSAASPGDPFHALRERWRQMLTGGDDIDTSAPPVRAALDVLGTTAERHLGALDRDADRSFLWADLDFGGTPFDQSVDIRLTYERVNQVATAYATTGTSVAADPGVRDDLIGALDWMYQHKYNENEQSYGNWFNWVIGAPLALNPATMLLFDDLGPERVASYMAAVDRFCPAPTDTGANRVWTCMGVAGRAALVGDDVKLARARDGLSPVLRYVTAGDGFYTDGSFIQHGRHPYTGGYGLSLLANVSRILYLVEGSPWEVTDPNRANVFEWVSEAYEPWLHKGSLLSAVRGREISRHTRQDHIAGQDAVLAVMWLAHVADAGPARELRGLVKHTIDEDRYRDFFAFRFGTNDAAGMDVSSIVQATGIAADASLPARAPAIRHKPYPMMDRVVHRRPEFTFAVSMSSARIFTYESINSENLRGWHTGSGMQYLYNDDLAHYDDGYWATVDHARLPGTTVSAGPRGNGVGSNHLSSKRWVGGAGLDTLGVAGMEFQESGSRFERFHLRLHSDGETVSVAWSPDGVRYVQTGTPVAISDMAEPHIGVYAGRGLTNASTIEARFERFDVWCGDEATNLCPEHSDEFDGDALNRDRWTRIVREQPDRFRLEDGALVLPTDRGEFDRGGDSTRNVVLQPMPTGVWRAEAVVRFVPQAQYHHAGIVLYQDDRNYVRIHRVVAAGGDRFDFTDQKDGTTRQLIISRPQNEFPGADLSGAPTGRKSWFMLDDEIAVLGAGVSASNGRPVETIVENRRLTSGDQRLTVDGRSLSTAAPWDETFDGIGWAHLAGPTSGADIGYAFLADSSLRAVCETRIGAWSDVNQGLAFADDQPIEHDYLALWFDHGVDPVDDTYGYVLLPGASVDDVRAYARRPGIEVLVNEPDVQAVRAGGVFGANFWAAGPTTVNGITCDGAASVLIRQDGSRLAVAVADPTQPADGTVRLTVPRAAARVVGQDPRITVESLRPMVTVAVDLAGARGSSAVAEFELRAG